LAFIIRIEGHFNRATVLMGRNMNATKTMRIQEAWVK